MNYAINTFSSVYGLVSGYIRALFVWLARRDINDWQAELDTLPFDAQRAMFAIEEEADQRVKDIQRAATVREMELRYRIAQTKFWIENK